METRESQRMVRGEGRCCKWRRGSEVRSHDPQRGSLCGGVLVIQPCCGEVNMQGGQNAPSHAGTLRNTKHNRQARPDLDYNVSKLHVKYLGPYSHNMLRYSILVHTLKVSLYYNSVLHYIL